MVILTAALAIWRYVARGVGDQDGLIIGGAGVVVFMVIQFFMRKARKGWGRDLLPPHKP